MQERTGRFLCVDLSSGNTETKQLTSDHMRSWLSGRAMNIALLYQLTDRPIDPLAPENPLVFTTGLLVGSPAPSASRLHINGISPLTGLLGSSNIGGRVAVRLYSLGYDGILVTGASKEPVYLDIDERGGRILPAGSLWGLDTGRCQEQLAKQLGTDTVETLSIGPAGENLNRFACIVTDRDHAAGRTGLGAVMGSKKLKVIAVRKPTKKAPSRFQKIDGGVVRNYFRQILSSPDFKEFSTLGGAGYVKWADDRALLSTRNYGDNRFDRITDIDGAGLLPARIRSRGCSGCPVKCKAILKFSSGRLKDTEVFRPEFEPMINLGAKCGLSDLQSIVYLDNLCTELGMDSTSASTAIAFAMDLYQRGLINNTPFKDLDLSWGNADTMEILIRQMASMEGPGAILGLGVRAAALQMGPGALPFAAHVKGLELTAYHPASLLGSALGYAISSRGGDYNNVYASLEHRWTPEQAKMAFGTEKALDPKSYQGKGRLIHRAVLVNIMVDTLGICKVPVLSMIGTFDLVPESDLAAALTGWDLTAEELFAIAGRVAALERLIGIRQGLTHADDTLPERFFTSGPAPIDRTRFQTMVNDFYRSMGWDSHGTPEKRDVMKIETLLPAFE